MVFQSSLLESGLVDHQRAGLGKGFTVNLEAL